MKCRVRRFILEILSLFSDQGEYSKAAHADHLLSCRCPFKSWGDPNRCQCQLPRRPTWCLGLRPLLLGFLVESFPMVDSHPFESAADRTSIETPSPRSDLPLILYFPAIKSLATTSRVLPKLSMAEILSSVACKCSSNPGSLQI